MKKWIGLALALMLLGMVPSALAVTDLSVEAYEKLVSTYSIDESIPAYDEYMELHPGAHPEAEIVIEGAQAARYEEEGQAGPTVLTD